MNNYLIKLKNYQLSNGSTHNLICVKLKKLNFYLKINPNNSFITIINSLTRHNFFGNKI